MEFIIDKMKDGDWNDEVKLWEFKKSKCLKKGDLCGEKIRK